jgi:hypothetical protein
MNQGYLLADANSLVYAHRTGGTNLLDVYYELAKKEHRLLTADARLTDELNYKASRTTAELASAC